MPERSGASRIMAEPLHFLVADSEPADDRRERRRHVGRSSGETYLSRLAQLVPGSKLDRVTPADADAALPTGADLAGYDAVILTGSPLHLYQETPETRREIDFMRQIFRSGTPAFGSCAGLQVATVAAGGTVRAKRAREAAFARRITPTDAGLRHQLLAGRPASFDALAIHSDEVESLPDGAVTLATNSNTPVQAVEIRWDGGVFWGVQYHPELSLHEIAVALRRQADALVTEGVVNSRGTLDSHAELIAELGTDPDRRDLAWRLGIDREITDPTRRTREITNFVEHLVRPTRSARGRE